jgi:hypothetical protein
MHTWFIAVGDGPVVIGKGLTWFEDADGEPDPHYLGQPFRWDDVKAFFASSFRQFVLDLDAAWGVSCSLVQSGTFA